MTTAPIALRDEVARLTELEAVIERGQRTFVEVGAALLEIRNARLYREAFATFEDYCQERWGMSRRYANMQIEGAEVVGTIVPKGLPAPANEAQARALIPLKDEPEKLTAAWEEAAADGAPTAAKVREAVAKRRDSDKRRAATAPDISTTRGQQIAAKSKERLERAVGNCSALARAADDFRVAEAMAVADADEVAGWVEVFTETRTAITRLLSRIKEAQ